MGKVKGREAPPAVAQATEARPHREPCRRCAFVATARTLGHVTQALATHIVAAHGKPEPWL